VISLESLIKLKDCVETSQTLFFIDLALISLSVSFNKEEVQGYRSNDVDNEKLVVLY